MKTLKIVILIILILACGILIIRENSYKNILLLALFFLSFLLGRVSKAGDKIESINVIKRQDKKIPQDFLEEQNRFNMVNRR